MTFEDDHCFDDSALCDEYRYLPSRYRYDELRSVFPFTILIFEHGGYYYGFNESAVALRILYGFDYYEKGGMLVVKIEGYIFESQILPEKRIKGFGYILDRNGSLTFRYGKKFRLVKPLSYYRQLGRQKALKARLRPAHPIKETKYWGDPDTRRGYGWHDGVWAPGLPSSRFYRKRTKR